VEALRSARRHLWLIGGSRAQRDGIEWTLAVAARRAGQKDLAVALARHNCPGYALPKVVGGGCWYFGRNRESSVAVACNLQADNGNALAAATVALVPLAFERPLCPLDGLFAVYPADRRPLAKVPATIDFLAESLGSAPVEGSDTGVP
jgi:hypothetical protein